MAKCLPLALTRNQIRNGGMILCLHTVRISFYFLYKIYMWIKILSKNKQSISTDDNQSSTWMPLITKPILQDFCCWRYKQILIDSNHWRTQDTVKKHFIEKMPRSVLSGSINSPKVDLIVDLGNPFLNLTFDGFLKIGTVNSPALFVVLDGFNLIEWFSFNFLWVL